MSRVDSVVKSPEKTILSVPKFPFFVVCVILDK